MRRLQSTCSPGDVLVAFTDGVTEALNTAEEEFGEERLKDLLRGVIHSAGGRDLRAHFRMPARVDQGHCPVRRPHVRRDEGRRRVFRCGPVRCRLDVARDAAPQRTAVTDGTFDIPMATGICRGR